MMVTNQVTVWRVISLVWSLTTWQMFTTGAGNRSWFPRTNKRFQCQGCFLYNRSWVPRTSTRFNCQDVFCIIVRGFHVPINVLTVKGVFCIFVRGFHVLIHLFHCQGYFLYNRSWFPRTNTLFPLSKVFFCIIKNGVCFSVDPFFGSLM